MIREEANPLACTYFSRALNSHYADFFHKVAEHVTEARRLQVILHFQTHTLCVSGVEQLPQAL